MNRPLLPRIGRRLRVLATCIDGPADVWLALRMLGWRLLLPALKRMLPLPRLVQLMWWGGERHASTAKRKECIVTLAYGLSGPASIPALDNCLERSLLAYRYLSKAGAEPELVVGLSRRNRAVQGHTWVTVDDQAFGRQDESGGEFETVVCFGPAGAIKPARPA